MNQAIFLASSALKPCMDRSAGGAEACLILTLMLFSLNPQLSPIGSKDSSSNAGHQEDRAKDRQNQDNGPRRLLPTLQVERKNAKTNTGKERAGSFGPWLWLHGP